MESINKQDRKRKKKLMSKFRREIEKISFFLSAHTHRDGWHKLPAELSVIEIGGVVCGWVAVGWLWAAWLTGWLVGANERERAAPCESSLYLDDKEPNLTQWNGRMVMETAFNLHRRSLFVDSLKVGVLACLCPLACPLRPAALLALYFASLRSR